MSKYKLIALDMDGTLLNSKKQISEKTKNSLIKLQENGIMLMLCSGRQFPGLIKSSQELKMDYYGGVLASYNGGKIVCAKNKHTIFENSIPNKLAIDILKHLSNFPVNPIVDDGKYVYTTNPDSFRLKEEATNNSLIIKTVNNLIDAIDFNPIKILVAAEEEIFSKYKEEILSPLVNKLDFTFSTPYYLEINNIGVNKGIALDFVCKKINISTSQVIVFGDGGNDVPLFRNDGLKVAMGNGSDELKKLADEVTLSNNEDGIVHTLQKHFPNIKF